MSQTLFVGHSLVGQVVPTMFNNFMDSENIDMRADAQVINGSSLRYNWDNGASAEGVNARAVLQSGDYDAVIVTEAIPLDEQIRYNDTEGYAARYFDLAHGANPDTQFFVYETWHSIGANTADWRAQIADDLPTWQGIVDHVNDTADAGAPEALLIPAGQAMARLHDRIEAGEVPGLNSIRDLFSDDIHLNDTGSWFVAALHASAVTGVDPATLPLETTNIWGVPFGGPDAALADVMAEVIDETLNDFVPHDSAPPMVADDDVVLFEAPDTNTPEARDANNELYGGWGNDQLYLGAGNDTLHGGRGDDALYGGAGDDVLIGGAGNDVLIGDGGNDTLVAGDGADTVSGGDGDDVFVLTGMPGSVLINDFGANGAQDMIDLSAIGGSMQFGDVAAAASFSGANTVLTFDVPNGVLTLTVRSDEPLTSADFGLPADPNGPWEIVPREDADDQTDPTGLTYSLEGADRHHFDVNPDTGDINTQSWFNPSHDQVWDVSGDRIYEVERVGSDAQGQEVSRTFFELETTPGGTVWREVEGTDGDAPAEQTGTFYLEGPDAYHFVIDPQSGEIDNVSWFDPSYDQVWDTSGDRVYEVERFALADDGSEISREALEMETTPGGVVWRVASSDDTEISPAQIMNALALPPAQEKDIPAEPDDSDAELILPI